MANQRAKNKQHVGAWATTQVRDALQSEARRRSISLSDLVKERLDNAAANSSSVPAAKAKIVAAGRARVQGVAK